MSFILQAPFPGPVTVLLLPDPELGDEEGKDISVEFKQSMNGTLYTYVKISSRKRMTFNWSKIGRGKLIEVQEFFKNYAGEHALFTDFRGDIWDVIFNTNPVDITMDTRSAPAGGTRFESGSLTLEFLGAQIA